MKFYKDLIESVIDIPRKDYAPGVFDNADTAAVRQGSRLTNVV